MPYPAYANYPRRRVPALVTHAPQRPSTPQGSQWGDVRQWAGQVVEKIRVASATGRVRFLPWYDPYTDETPEIRAEYPKMLVESSIKAAFQTKILSVISLPVQFNPVDDDDPRQNEAAEFFRWMFKRMKGGTPGVGWSILHPAIIKGHSVCEKVKAAQPLASGKFRGKLPVVMIKSKDTDRVLQLAVDPYRNVSGFKAQAFNQGRVYPPEDFVIFSYLSLFESPAGTSDFRAAYRPYWIKNTTWQLRGLHLDKYVGPYLKGTYTGQDQKDALEAALEQARSTTWLTVPIGTAVDAIDLSMRGTADFEAAIKDCDREMLIAIVGAHLQILEGQTAGARGNTKVHKETAELIQWWLADRLAQAYYEQVVVPSTEENYWDVDPPEVSVGAVTEEEVLNSLKVYELMQKLGAKISSREVYKIAGKTKPTEPDDVLTPAQPPRQPPGPAGGEAGGASPFSERVRRFCQEGENKGLPGVCPEDKGKSPGGAATPAAPAALPHAFGPANPAAPDAGRAAYAGLSPEDALALKEYSWHAFDDVNKALRGEAPASAETQGHVDRLNALMAKTPDFKEPVTVFRAVRGSKMPGGGKAFVEGLKAAAQSGAPVSYRGFASTTTRPETAVNMAVESTHGIVFEIAARKGLDLKPYSHLPDEDEVLLPEGAGFKVTSVEKRTDPSTQEDYWHVKAEHLPGATPTRATSPKALAENADGGKFVDESQNAWTLPARGEGPARAAAVQPG